MFKHHELWRTLPYSLVCWQVKKILHLGSWESIRVADERSHSSTARSLPFECCFNQGTFPDGRKWEQLRFDAKKIWQHRFGWFLKHVYSIDIRMGYSRYSLSNKLQPFDASCRCWWLLSSSQQYQGLHDLTISDWLAKGFWSFSFVAFTNFSHIFTQRLGRAQM